MALSEIIIRIGLENFLLKQKTENREKVGQEYDIEYFEMVPQMKPVNEIEMGTDNGPKTDISKNDNEKILNNVDDKIELDMSSTKDETVNELNCLKTLISMAPRYIGYIVRLPGISTPRKLILKFKNDADFEKFIEKSSLENQLNELRNFTSTIYGVCDILRSVKILELAISMSFVWNLILHEIYSSLIAARSYLFWMDDHKAMDYLEETLKDLSLENASHHKLLICDDQKITLVPLPVIIEPNKEKIAINELLKSAFDELHERYNNILTNELNEIIKCDLNQNEKQSFTNNDKKTTQNLDSNGDYHHLPRRPKNRIIRINMIDTKDLNNEAREFLGHFAGSAEKLQDAYKLTWVQEIVENCTDDKTALSEITNALISKQPPFVKLTIGDYEPLGDTASYGNFILDFTAALKRQSGKRTDNDHVEACKTIVAAFSEFRKSTIYAFDKSTTEKLSGKYSVDYLSGKKGQGTLVECCNAVMLRFFATLKYLVTTDVKDGTFKSKLMNHPSSWMKNPYPADQSIEKIKVKNELDSVDIDAIFKIATSADSRRYDAQNLLFSTVKQTLDEVQNQIETDLKILSTGETKREEKNKDRAKYLDKLKRGIRDPTVNFLEKMAKGTLQRNDMSGLIFVPQALAKLKEDYEKDWPELTADLLPFVDIYAKLSKIARSKVLAAEAENIPDVETILTEKLPVVNHSSMRFLPPTIEFKSKTMVPDPPIWIREKNCLREHLLYSFTSYCVRSGVCTYKDRLKMVYYSLETVARQNSYMKKFAHRFESVETESQYTNMIYEIANDLDPENRQDATNFQDQWYNQAWKAQLDGETEEDLFTRLEECHNLAFPNISGEACLRIKLIQDFISALRSKELFDYLHKHFFTEIYETSDILKILEGIREWHRKQKKIKMTLRARQDMYQSRETSKNEKTVSDSTCNNISASNRNEESAPDETRNSNYKGSIFIPDYGKKLKNEIKRLSYNQNFNETTNDYIVKPEDIPESHSNRPGFNPKNYVSCPTKYSEIISKAKRNLIQAALPDEQKWKGKRTNTKLNKRKYENRKNRKNPIVSNNIGMEDNSTSKDPSIEDWTIEEEDEVDYKARYVF